MVTTSPQHAKPATPEVADKLYMENTLLRVIGALFTHDAKRARSRTDKIEILKTTEHQRIVVEPHPNYGQPGPLAHKVMIALLKKHSSYGRPIRDEISFTRRELGRLIGRADFGGNDLEQILFALQTIRRTAVTASFKSGDRYVAADFNLFDQLLTERRDHIDGPLEACTVVLAQPIIASLLDDHFTCLNHALMQRLGTIGQALYMRCFFHMANLYNGRNKRSLVFAKRYDDICREWLGGLTVLDRKSKIDKEQLGPHLAQLQAEGVLASTSIDKTADGRAFKLTFRPGPLFFEDYGRFYQHRNQGELQWDFTGDSRGTIEPMRAAALFVEKQTGALPGTVGSVIDSDTNAARAILQEISFDAFPDFLAFALAKARATNFDVQRLAGLKGYVAPYLQQIKLNQQHRTREAEAARQRAEQDRHDQYLVWYRAELKRLIATLDPATLAAIEAQIPTSNGPIAHITRAMTRDRLLAQHFADQIPEFETWKPTPSVR